MPDAQSSAADQSGTSRQGMGNQTGTTGQNGTDQNSMTAQQNATAGQDCAAILSYVGQADPNTAANQLGMATGQNGADNQKAKATADQQAADQAAAIAAGCVAQASVNGAQATDTQATGSQATGVVCSGSTVTLSGDGGSPAASSNQFPVGTMLKVTNPDNNKSVTVPVPRRPAAARC
ncbi:hypothetical protein ACIA5G_33825 [Amycolatopsis sp. NPDC051758]|uniref:hypothetical protein n=1 Tax=Amycolatopsis sp. NPDC051758 TaxID=3363935 RepID=UPI0037A51BB4